MLKSRKKELKRLFSKCFAGLLLGAFCCAGEAYAYFNDFEENSGNEYSAGTLDFSLQSSGTDTLRQEVEVVNNGTLRFEYAIKTENESGDLCDYLKLAASRNGTDIGYSESLKDFVFSAGEFSDPDKWVFEISLTAGASFPDQQSVCNFDFVFDGVQAGGSGFYDQESATMRVAIGSFKPIVNIIYPVGGEEWYAVPDNCADIPACSLWCQDHGMNSGCQYSIRWRAENMIGSDGDLLVDLYFSNDSGANWFSQIAGSIPNTGEYFWKVPYDSHYVTENARIKVIARHKDHSFISGEDQSQDFCPPMLTLSDILGTSAWENPIEVSNLFIGQINFLEQGGEDPIEEQVEPEKTQEDAEEEIAVEEDEDAPEEDPLLEPEEAIIEEPESEVLPEGEIAGEGGGPAEINENSSENNGNDENENI